MRKEQLLLKSSDNKEVSIPVYSINTLIVGAGAAGLRCATELHSQGVKDIAIVVDKLGNGTSNNSGSDKQTYYKIGLFGDQPDSPINFAKTLYQGGMMHGDLAYIEALGSAPAFFELCRIGVPFPHNSFGAYVGYKTDHDPRQRATSAGPKTSMMMFKQLLKQVQRNETEIFDRHEAVKLLYSDDNGQRRVIGALCVNKNETYRDNYGLVAFNAQNIVLATGGPGELYKISVWPHGQIGSHGLALEIGAAANNLTELQFGPASIKFRWNLSGTYQQVVPDYFSTDADGTSKKKHFLHDYFDDMSVMATNIFLKGYQWPFHAERLQENGSSIIDIAIHNEIAAGRKVFMDLMHNPVPSESMSPFNISDLQDEARIYLERSGATQETPYERLKHMNIQSIELYAEHQIDLREPLEISICAQHCNGGISVNKWWETSVNHLFAIGELAGTHGVRPGGSALNSGQVGATRSSKYIANVYTDAPLPCDDFYEKIKGQIQDQFIEYDKFLSADENRPLSSKSIRVQIQKRMSESGAFIRSMDSCKKALIEAKDLYQQIINSGINCSSASSLTRATEDKMLALTSIAFLQAIKFYIENNGGSRGGYMILDENGDLVVRSKRGKELRHRSENKDKRKEIIELSWNGNEFEASVTPTRPLPVDDSWFETIWNDYNQGKVYK